MTDKTPQQLAEMVTEHERRIEVMQAFLRGARIEYRLGKTDTFEWLEIARPSWCWSRVDYRIKAENAISEEAEDDTKQSMSRLDRILARQTELMKAFLNGAKIESIERFADQNSEIDWADDSEPTWGWASRNYRIKDAE